FYPRFLAHGLEKKGVECRMAAVNIPELNTLRKSTPEMRATNMSRFLTDTAVDHLAAEINKVAKGVDAVIMPAVLGIYSDAPVERLRKGVDVPVWFVPTTPASVPGVRCQLSLRDLFIRLGGEFLPGDTVSRGEFENNRLRRIFTVNLGDMPLEADNFIISTGSFFGHGLIADMERIYEPVFGLDLNVKGGRTEWYEKDFFASQPYMTYGVTTDNKFRPSRRGETIENLYATGALLAGFNALKEGSGAGITLASALHAASCITG
ncbi:MAG: anaerobic glycerol-3-phosphate dehydrogenase subunit B, partial [Muribaculaceae bacterium]|nr:anaerobic glycerol-3-phosphate dehydrogenase subunit B [Muribaculaceae bacterium]